MTQQGNFTNPQCQSHLLGKHCTSAMRICPFNSPEILSSHIFFFPVHVVPLESVTKTPWLNVQFAMGFTFWHLLNIVPLLTESMWGGFIFIQYKVVSVVRNLNFQIAVSWLNCNSVKRTSNVKMIRKNSDIKENKSGNEILWLVLSQLYLKDAHIFYVNVYL